MYIIIIIKLIQIYDTVCTKQNLPTASTCTVYRERDRMAQEFALTRAKLSLPNSSLHTSDLGRPCLVDKCVASLDSA